MTATTGPDKGSYLLIARLDQPLTTSIGRLGSFHFSAGWYAYAGSALGPGGIRARLARHRRVEKKLHWHIDYLLVNTILETSWQISYPDRLECAWAAAMRRIRGTQIPAPGFGASDCRCISHLVYLPERPSDTQVAKVLRSASPQHIDLRHITYALFESKPSHTTY